MKIDSQQAKEINDETDRILHSYTSIISQLVRLGERDHAKIINDSYRKVQFPYVIEDGSLVYETPDRIEVYEARRLAKEHPKEAKMLAKAMGEGIKILDKEI